MGEAECHASSESRALASIEPAAPIEVKQVAALRFSPDFAVPYHHTKPQTGRDRFAGSRPLTGR